MSDERLDRIARLIRDIPDFPTPGIVFKDITPLLADPRGFVTALDMLQEGFADKRLDAVIGVESRGFIFGAALAARMSASFVPVRKPGKLPGEADRVEYELEYGTDALEMHTDALRKGWRVAIIDDLLATGGTARAAAELVRRQQADLAGWGFIMELTFLEGRKHLEGAEVLALLQY